MRETALDWTAKWLAGDGPEADIVVGCRGSLSRNLADFPFPARCTEHEKQAVCDRILEALDSREGLSRERYYQFGDLDEMEQGLFVERELADEEVVRAQGPRGVVVAEDQSASIVMNGGDHLRVHVLVSGLKSEKVWSRLNDVESFLGTLLDFAFHDHYGFLTASLNRVGTGLKLTALVHLPALTMAGKILLLEQRVRERGHRLEGLLGPVSEGKGALYGVTNAATLGRSEEEMAFHLRHVAQELVAEERALRESLLTGARLTLEDQVGRAVGTAQGARLLEYEEAVTLLSSIRLGVTTGLLEGYDLRVLNELFIVTRDAHIRRKAGQDRHELAQSAERAELFRAHFL